MCTNRSLQDQKKIKFRAINARRIKTRRLIIINNKLNTKFFILISNKTQNLNWHFLRKVSTIKENNFFHKNNELICPMSVCCNNYNCLFMIESFVTSSIDEWCSRIEKSVMMLQQLHELRFLLVTDIFFMFICTLNQSTMLVQKIDWRILKWNREKSMGCDGTNLMLWAHNMTHCFKSPHSL